MTQTDDRHLLDGVKRDLSASERAELQSLRAFHAEHADRPCTECGRLFAPRSTIHTHYCSSACRKAVHKRRVQFGLRAYDAAMSWRIDRPEGALVELTAITDQFAGEERLIRAKRERVVEATQKAQAKALKAGAASMDANVNVGGRSIG